MKISKIIAGMSAAAILASMTAALPAGAADPKVISKVDGVVFDEANGIWQYYITDLKDKEDESTRFVTDDSFFESSKDLAKINGFKITFTVDDETEKLLEGRIAGTEETWVGGGFGVNSDSTGWKQFAEWGPVADEAKPDLVVFTDEEADNTWSISYQQDDPIFTKKETYGQIWMQSWGAGTFTVTDIELSEVEVEPIGNAYISFGAQSWTNKLDAPAFSVDFSTKGWDWQQVDVSKENFEKALDEGKTLADIESVTVKANLKKAAENEGDATEAVSAGDATDVTEATSAPNADADADADATTDGAAEESFTFPGKLGWNGSEAAEYGWQEATFTDNTATLSNILFEDVPESAEGAGDGHSYYMMIGGNEEGSVDYTLDFYIRYKSTGDPHDGMEVPKEWNTYYYDKDSASGDVTQEPVAVYLDEEFTLEADIAQEIDHMYFVAPTVVFDKDFEENEDFAEKYDVSVALEIDGKKVEIDSEAKKDADGNVVQMWAEDTGANTKANTARLYGGYNEWADKFVAEEKFEGAEKIKYVVTIAEKEAPEEPKPQEDPNEKPKDNPENKPDPKNEPKDNPDAAPKAGAATLALGAIALAGAAIVVSKKKD